MSSHNQCRNSLITTFEQASPKIFIYAMEKKCISDNTESLFTLKYPYWPQRFNIGEVTQRIWAHWNPTHCQQSSLNGSRLLFTPCVSTKHPAFLSNCSCWSLQRPPPCFPVVCEQVDTTCRGWSQAACPSLATGRYRLTVEPRASDWWGRAAAMNWTAHRWGCFLPHPSLLFLTLCVLFLFSLVH